MQVVYLFTKCKINNGSTVAVYNNCGFTSAALKNIAFHKLGHAQHYGQTGCTFWAAYRGAIITEISKLNQFNLQPYGSGNDVTTAPIIATGEMWGNHCEYIL